MAEFEREKAKYTIIPFSELALHLGIAGKKGKIVMIRENWAVIELDGRKCEGLPPELIDIGDLYDIAKNNLSTSSPCTTHRIKKRT